MLKSGSVGLVVQRRATLLESFCVNGSTNVCEVFIFSPTRVGSILNYFDILFKTLTEGGCELTLPVKFETFTKHFDMLNIRQ